MARYNEILTGRHNRFLQRLLSMKGEPPAPQLASEVMPHFELDRADNAENRFTAGWRLYGAVASTGTPLAGNAAASFVRMPANNNTIAVIEKITIATGATAADSPVLTRTIGPGAQTAGVGAGSRDSRQVGVSSALIGTSINAGAIAGFRQWQGSNPGAFAQLEVILFPDQELVLMPGDIYTVWSALLANAITASFFWRERALEEGELT